MRSPRMAPCVNGLEGSTATMPTVLPRRRYSAGERARERALAGASAAGDADDVRLARVREQRAQVFAALRRLVFDAADDAGERAAVARKETFDEVVHRYFVTFS